jgi:sporulation protein YlmC with PRC-barrel domain
MEINVELLIGRTVRDVDGETIGRIEEFKIELDDNSCVLDSYLVGSSALIERLSAWTLVRPIARALSGRRFYSLYQVPWQDIDLSDPQHPRLRTAKRDLRHAK